jgi:deoxyribose-phosphate aldolase
MAMDARELAATIDQTLLKPTVGEAEARLWMAAQSDGGFASLCVSPALVPAAARALAGTTTRVCTVVAFPLGYALSVSKADEARRLLAAGAVEIDMVVNIGAVLEGAFDAVEADVASVVEAVAQDGGAGSLVKVILETGYLSPEQIGHACKAAVRAGADFVKTSTGFGPRGASVEDVRIMRAAVGPDVGVKAAGGIRTLDSALAMLDAGATRIGTSSGLEIVAAFGSTGGVAPFPVA